MMYILKINPTLLREQLNIPPKVRIKDVVFDDSTGGIKLKVEVDGGKFPEVLPIFEYDYGTGKQNFRWPNLE